VKIKAIIVGVAAATLTAGSASALTFVNNGYTISDTSFGGQTGIHFVSGQTDVLSAIARVNQDDSTVTFSSTDTFDTTTSGEAVISDSLGKGKTDPFNNLTVLFGHAWSKVTFSFDGGPADMTVKVNGAAALFGPPSCSFCTIASSGQNKFTVFAPTGVGITSLNFAFSQENITSGRQFRVVDVTDTGGTGTSVPEPAAWTMMILGFGGIGAMMRRRRLFSI
jgi:hypothetical protein